jgi:hypothetical protein
MSTVALNTTDDIGSIADRAYCIDVNGAMRGDLVSGMGQISGPDEPFKLKMLDRSVLQDTVFFPLTSFSGQAHGTAPSMRTVATDFFDLVTARSIVCPLCDC